MRLFIILFFIPLVSIAEDRAPEPFTDSTINRTLEDGTVQKFDGNKYKIVRRKRTNERKKRTEKIKVIRTTQKIVRIKPTPNNNVSLFTGYGPLGLERSGSSVGFKRGVTFGVGYDRKLNYNSSLRIIGISNGTIMGGVGFGF